MVEGRITLQTDGAPVLLVVPQNPVVECHVPPAAEQHLYGRVAYIGQASVRLQERVDARPDDLLVPSGANDGTATVLRLAKAAVRAQGGGARAVLDLHKCIVGRVLEEAEAGAE